MIDVYGLSRASESRSCSKYCNTTLTILQKLNLDARTC